MNIFYNLNQTINFIEKSLFDENINLKRASEILGTSLGNFKSTFSLLTGYTINEYIKLRRLSECVKMLADNKIVDIAIMCGYNSRAGFSRAFKEFYGFNPSEFNSNNKFKYFNRIVFDEDNMSQLDIQFQFKELGELMLYGERYEVENYFDIRHTWKEAREKYPAFYSADKSYGLVYKDKQSGKLLYYVALESKFDELNKRIKLPASKYLTTFIKYPKAINISKLGKMMSSKTIASHPDIEIYLNDGVELLYKI